MKKIVFIFWSIIFLAVSSAQATPPSEILLKYDSQGKTLHVTIKHVSSHLRKHHIRKLEVYKNDIQVGDYNYNNQTKATEQDQNVQMEAVAGDVIRVLAICSEAGRGEATLTIPVVSREETSEPSAKDTAVEPSVNETPSDSETPADTETPMDSSAETQPVP